MNSRNGVLLGTEMPQIVHVPPGIVSVETANDAIDLANSYEICDGNPLSPSQEFRLRNAMGERADGTWAASLVADFGGRQGAGKTDTIAARELAGILLLGERLILHTAHEDPTAGEAFLRMWAIFQNWDDLGRLLKGSPKRAHGDRGFEFLTGQRLLYKARTGKSGRGFTKADLTVYDEAQHLHAEHLAGSAPTRLALPNPQSWWAGSGGMVISDKAWEIRLRAIGGDGGRLAYTEHTAQTYRRDEVGKLVFASPDPLSRAAWAEANPGYGRWVTEEGMQAMLDELGVDKFERECLCVWEIPPEMATGPVDPERWAQLVDGESLPERDIRLAIDAPPDLTSATFVLAGRRDDGLLHGSVRYRVHFEELGQIDEIAATLAAGHGVPLIVPPGSPARAWLNRFADITLDHMSGVDYADACQAIRATVREGNLRHRGQPELDRAVGGLAVRKSGDLDVWARRTSTSDISPFVALTCALGRLDTEYEPDLGDPLDSIGV